MYFPQLIEAGMVYKAIPPLYSIRVNGKEKYFTEQIDIIKYVQGLFLSNHKMDTIKKQSLKPKDVTLFFMKNADYLYFINKISDTYAVTPYLLEMVLFNYLENKRSFNLQKLQKSVTSTYRFMTVEKKSNTIVVSGVIDKSQLIVLNDKFVEDCRDLINIISSNDYYRYLINGKLQTLYEIMNIYNSAMPSNLSRYKGLGEMDKDQLAESTLYPGSNRTLVRYTLKDAKEELELIRDYESNPKKILSLVENVTRDDLLD